MNHDPHFAYEDEVRQDELTMNSGGGFGRMDKTDEEEDGDKQVSQAVESTLIQEVAGDDEDNL